MQSLAGEVDAVTGCAVTGSTCISHQFSASRSELLQPPPKKKLNFCWFTNPSARLTPENSREKCDASPRLCHNSSSKLLGRTMIKIQPAYVYIYIYIYSNCFISLQEGAPRSDRFLFLAGQQLVFKTCQ